MGNWDGWDKETVESLEARTGKKITTGTPAAPAPVDDDPIIDGIRLSSVKGSPPAQRQQKGPKLDRGRVQKARWCYVDGNRNIIEHALAKSHGVGTAYVFFRSIREAKRYIVLLGRIDNGLVRVKDPHAWLQVKFSLKAPRPDGLLEHVVNYVCDFEYEELEYRIDRRWVPAYDIPPLTGNAALFAPEERWVHVVEDVKGFKQDVYKLKSKWFAIQYGYRIREV